MPFASFCLCFHGLWILNSIFGRGASKSSFQLWWITSWLYWKAAHKKKQPTKRKAVLESWLKWAVIYCREVFFSFSVVLSMTIFSASLKKETESGKITTQKTCTKIWLKPSGEYHSQKLSSYSTSSNKLNGSSLESTGYSKTFAL